MSRPACAETADLYLALQARTVDGQCKMVQDVFLRILQKRGFYNVHKQGGRFGNQLPGLNVSSRLEQGLII